MPKLLGIVGVLVICAGIDLLWQSRHEIRFWVAAYFSVFRAMLRQQEAPRVFPSKEAVEKRRGAVRVLLGMGFVFFLGPMLLALGLTLMFFPAPIGAAFFYQEGPSDKSKAREIEES